MILSLKNKHNNTPNDCFFGIVEQKLLVCNNGHKIGLNLNQITNIRVAKSRNLSINALLILIICICYLSILVSCKINFPLQSLFTLSVLLCLRLSFSFRWYSYKLVLNTKFSGFLAIKLSKNHVFPAYSLLDQFVNNTLIFAEEECRCSSSKSKLFMA
jgi:hypothetical protein